MAKTKTQNPPQIENVQVLTSYYANGVLYALVEKDDTVRFYRLDKIGDDRVWIPTDIYLKGQVAVIGVNN